MGFERVGTLSTSPPGLSTVKNMRAHPKLLCRFVAPYFAGPENRQRLSHNQLATLPWASEEISHSLFLVYGRSGLRPSLVQGLRPRNAPLWLATVSILPQQCV